MKIIQTIQTKIVIFSEKVQYIAWACCRNIIIISIFILIFKEDNVFSMIVSLPYGPPVKTLIIIGFSFIFGLSLFSDFFVSVAMLVVRYLLGEEKPVHAL